MRVEMVDGLRVLKLRGEGARDTFDERLELVQLWRLVSGGRDLRDTAVGPRRFL